MANAQGGYHEDGHFMMHNYNEFGDVFDFDTSRGYGRKQLDDIEHFRNTFGELFVDRVLKLIGITRPASIYPPRSQKGLQRLHAEIVKTEGIADHLKLSLLYYVLLDCKETAVEKNGGLLEDRIVKKFYLPSSYELLMKGLWYMDRGEFYVALQYLTHPSLLPTFEDDILDTLVRFSGGDLSLPLIYYHTVQPALKTSTAIESLFTALATASVTEAFYFSRGQPENIHQQLFKTLIKEVLRNSEGSSDFTGARSVELVGLPFTSEEEAWFEEYLTYGEGRNLKRAADTVLMRRIAVGKFGDAMNVTGKLSSRTLDGMDWDSIRDAVESGLGPRLDMENVVQG